MAGLEPKGVHESHGHTAGAKDEHGHDKSLKGLGRGKIAIPAIAIIGLIGGVIVFMIFKSKNTGATVAAQQGQAYPVDAQSQDGTEYAALTGLQDQISNAFGQFNQQLTGLSSQLQNQQSATPSTPDTSSSLYTIGAPSSTPGGPGSLGGVPIYNSPSDASAYVLSPFGSQFKETGAPVAGGAYGGFYPVAEPGGGTGYIHGVDIAQLQGPTSAA